MRTLRTCYTLSALGALAALAARPAMAQVDVRPPLPNVLLLVDNSGSMEYKADGTPVTVCDPNYATTSDMNRWTTLVTVLTGTINDRGCLAVSRTSDAFNNEYTFGGVQPYDWGYKIPYHRIVSHGCVAGPGKTPTNIYDWPSGLMTGWSSGIYGGVKPHKYDSTDLCLTWSQQPDGLLDAFQDRVRFGLMTFDSSPNEGTGVVSGSVDAANGFAGMWSYYNGWRDGSGTPVQGNPDGCTLANYELGARNEAAPPWEGRLIAMGKPSATLDEPGGVREINDRIQQALIALRPYGATPLAGMFEDAYTFFRQDVSKDPLDPTQPFAPAGDPYFGAASHGCRKTYMIVLSDGEPNLDWRPFCETGTGHCPYRQPYEVAYDLANPADPTKAVYTFAVGFGLSSGSGYDCSELDIPGDFAAGKKCDGATGGLRGCCTLSRIAYEGGTQHAYFADDLLSLRAALSTVLAQIAATSTSRTLPSFASGTSSASAIIKETAPATAYEFVSSFDPVTENNLWEGNLQRKRWVCADHNDGQGLQARLVAVDKGAGDDFSANVNQGKAGRPRLFKTFVGDPDGALIRSASSIRPTVSDGTDGLGTYSGAPVSGSNSFVASKMYDHPEAMSVTAATTMCSNALLNASDPQDCARKVMNWALGGTNGGGRPTRDGHEFGGIYHSTPFAYGRPDDYLRDESYAAFASIEDIELRPLMLYTATTDGQLHAFKVAPNDPNDQTGLLGDQLDNNELWSFIPPYVLPNLIQAYPRTQMVLLDGAPVVQDIVFERSQTEALAGGGAGKAEWHTVLLAGGGMAGGFYYALDVTHPTAPTFLWQLSTDSSGAAAFGPTSATPALATIAYKDGDVPKEVAVAILPGGGGTVDTSTSACLHSGTPRQTPVAHFHHIKDYAPRANVRCWLSGPGRSLTIVRLSDGKVLKTFRGLSTDGPASMASVTKVVAFDAPLTGTPVPYPSRPGQVADRIYVGDADGTLWRVNLADPNADNWDVSIMFDAYPLSNDPLEHSPDVFDSGQPVAIPPVVAVDGVGDTIVLFATGDQESFFQPSDHMRTRVWSLTEKPLADATSHTPFHVEANWYVPFVGGKRVTGPIAMFDTVAYFSTFSPTGGGNVCQDGFGSIWGVDYVQHTADVYPVARLAVDPNANPITYVAYKDQAPGTVVFGVGVTQKPSCYVMSDPVSDQYSPHHTHISTSTAPVYQLVYQTGSGGQATEGASTNTSSQVLPALSQMTRIDSWASIVE